MKDDSEGRNCEIRGEGITENLGVDLIWPVLIHSVAEQMV